MPNSSIHRKNIHRFGQIFSANQNRIEKQTASKVEPSNSRPADRTLTTDPCCANSTDFMIVCRYKDGWENAISTGGRTISVARRAIQPDSPAPAAGDLIRLAVTGSSG